MTQHGISPEQAKLQAKQATRQASPVLEPLGRFGYAAKGVVYAVVGVLATQAAIGAGGATTDTRGALQTIIDAPFGRVLLAIVAIGLVGYALWRLVQAFMDTENKGSDAKGYAARTAYAVVGLAYLGLAFSAVQLIRGAGGQSGNSEQGWTARLLAQPFGRVLVALIGAVVLGIGAYQIYKGVSAKFREELKLGEMSQTEQIWATRSGRIGFLARGVVFGLIGIFFVIASLRSDPSQARGFAGALQTLAERPYILGVVALGLIAYAVFCMVEARYRRMVIR